MTFASFVAVGAGTSFPAQPAYGNNRPFYRSDSDLLYFYDGARWLTVNLYRDALTPHDNFGPSAAVGNVGRGPTFGGDHDMWIETFYASAYIATTNDGSNYYDVSLTASLIGVLATASTSAGAPDTFLDLSAAVDAVVSGGQLIASIAKTGAPGTWFLATAYTYRLIG